MGEQYITDSAALIATADAIRSKGGTNQPITWDVAQGFKTAIDALASGGGANIDIQTYTTATEAGRTSPVHFLHSLGVVPDLIAIIYAGNGGVSNTLGTIVYIDGAFAGCTYYATNGSLSGLGTIPNPDSTTPGITNITNAGFDFQRPVTLGYFYAGTSYEIICIKFRRAIS